MSADKTWSMYETTLKIWEEDAVAGTKLPLDSSPPLIIERLITSLSFVPNSEVHVIKQPGFNRLNHYGEEFYVLDMAGRLQEFEEQFYDPALAIELFNRISSSPAGPPFHVRRFTIEASFISLQDHPKQGFQTGENLVKLKQCFANMPSFNATDTPAAIFDRGFSFDCIDTPVFTKP